MSHTATCAVVDHPPHEALPSTPPAPLVAPDTTLAAPSPQRRHPATRAWSFRRTSEVRWAALATAFFVGGLSSRLLGAPVVLSGGLFALCYLTGGWEPTLAGLRALRAKTLDVDLLMVVAALVAAGIGQVVDGGLLIVIFATSGALEAVASERTRRSVRSLLDLAPEQAARLREDGLEETVAVADLVVGDVVVVRPGERIGVDGIVVRGASDVEESQVTGEPMPVAKHVGAAVFAGTLNGHGLLEVQVSRAATDTVVARIVALVAEASATKARLQLFIEKVEQRYSLVVVGATIALFVVPLLAGASLQPTLLRAMTFMIVASPCALVLATMPPLLSAIANASRHGVLVKSAVVMELLGRTDLVAFDKTGTLTMGVPALSDLVVLPGATFDADEVLGLAAAAEVASEHPLGRAVLAAARARGQRLPEATGFLALPGRGVMARVEGRRVEVGSVPPEGRSGPLADVVARLEARGRTVAVVAVDGTTCAVLGLADRARPGAAAIVRTLGLLTGRWPVVLTGDNQGAADRLAQELGVTDARGGLLPADKVAALRSLQAHGLRVVAVGDGVNDAPSLAAADVGVAMGQRGSGVTLETADVVLVRDELATIPAVITLSRRARRVLVQNLVVASLAIVALVAVDLSGHLPLPLGVAGHEGSTVLVGLNGLRLLGSRSWRGPGPDLL